MTIADEEKNAESVGDYSGPDNGSLTSPDGEDMAPQQSQVESIWPAENLSQSRQVVMIFVCCMTQWCTQGAFAQTLTILHVIGASFGVTAPSQLAWLVAGYSLTVGTFILFSGRLGDAFGYKRMLLIGLAWFSLWSVISGLSVFSNYVLAVFARVLTGIGPAICLPNALAILGAVYPPGHKKAMVFACFGAVAPVGAIVSAAIGAAISIVWWPWALWAFAIWLAILAGLAYIAIPDLPRKDDILAEGWSWQAVAAELDILGAITGVPALVLFNFAWNQAPISGWGTATIIVPLVLGVLLAGVFAFVEVKVATKPLLPFDIINGVVAFVLGVVACGWASFGIWVLYLIQILEEVRGLSPVLTTGWLSPLPVVGVIAAGITGALLGPLQVRPPVVMTLALAAFTIGITLIATVPPHQIYWGQIFVCTIVIPFGMDMSFPAATLILSNAVKKQHQGVAASLVNTVVNYSISLAVGIATTVETHVAHGDALTGFRGGLYVGVGLASFGFIVCVVFLIRDYRAQQKSTSPKQTV
ncbi:major facilitator superfamily transporter [Xylariaceae sp. FL0255]|nr:major facilitator superfamily transporter [Xylariaceae sp. FL0255]